MAEKLAKKDIPAKKPDDGKKKDAGGADDQPSDKNFGSFWKCSLCGHAGYWFAPGMMNAVAECKGGGHNWVRDKS